MLGTLAALITTQALSTESRFELTAPLALPPVYIHHELAKYGVGQSTARRLDLQARVLWIDATANLGRVNSEEKIAGIVAKAKEVGFNTLVFDIKPINGYTMYPSKLTEQITFWRDSKLVAGFDPLKIFCDEAKKQGISLFVAMNAFSEGHSYGKRDFGKENNQFFKPGWGYEHPELQTVRYIPIPTWNGFEIAPGLDPANYAQSVAVFTDPKKASGEWFVTVEKSGNIRSSSSEKPASLNGLALLAATGDAAVELARYRAGDKIVVRSAAKFVASGEDQNQIPLMMNPHSGRMQQRTFAFIDEVAKNYEIDGLLYDDRLRFGGLDSDFSETTRIKFEQAIGEFVDWPNDIYTYNYSPSLTPYLQPGRLFDAWLAFRAQTLSNWVAKARAHLKVNRPTAQFGIYAGSWYGDYQKYGNNYASPNINAGFPFLTSAYKQTGFASKLDVLITGCYYPHGTVYDAVGSGGVPGRTVEAGGILSNRVARDQSWVYAGIMLDTFKANHEGLESALQAATATTQGVMVFDLSHGIEDFWPIFKQAFKNPAQAPHQVPGLIEQVRKTRAEFDAKGFKEPPFPIFEGAPGTGF